MATVRGTEGKYGKHFIQELHDPHAGTPEFQEMYKRFSRRILWMDSNVVPGAFQMNTAWYHHVPDRDPVFEEHVHEDDEIIGFFGTNPDDPYALDAELTFSIDGEDHLIDKTTLVFVPGGLPHGRISIKRVGTPIFHFSVVTGKNYDNGAYDTGDGK